MLDPNRFVKERKEQWEALEKELGEVASGRFTDFDVVRARALGRLYRRASADLIRARTETANEGMIDYLNGLVGRAYGQIYRGRRMRWWAFLSFLAYTFPRKVRAHKGVILGATAVFMLGALFGLFAEYLDSTAKFSLLPPQYAAIEDNIDTIKTAQAGGVMGGGSSAAFSAFLMSNNIRVSFLAFALGVTAGIGTTFVLFHNGVLLGMVAAVFTRHSLSLYFWAFILPHGITELTAIFIAGAAGYLLARAIVAPGLYGRRAALKRYGKEAVDLIFGCAFLLVIAGLIEGFVTPQGFIPHGVKLLFAFATLIALVAYFGYNEPILASFGLEAPEPGEAAPGL